MKIRIVGAGPSGLYLAILLKRAGLGGDLLVVEQNAKDSTFGFGVVFSDSALEFLREDDPDTLRSLASELERWSDIHIVHKGIRVVIDGVGFAALGRLRMLQVLQNEAEKLGVSIQYNRSLADTSAFAAADLLVGADGVNSIVRREAESEFETKISFLRNSFAWFGTTKKFEALTQTFVEHRTGFYNAHHYRYSPDMSTFIVECDEETMSTQRLDKLGENNLKALLEEIFAETLQGHPLVSNRSIWRHFPIVSNGKWSVGNRVILGDALHTAHFSIGSGTRLAIEDAIFLARSLKKHSRNVPEALDDFAAARKPILEKLVNAANSSASWYETFPERMHLPPYEFAMSYVTRSGRVSRDKLADKSPEFVAAYDQHTAIANAKSEQG